MARRYRPLGFLRICLALLVVVQHALFLAPEPVRMAIEPLEMGSVAVLIFFVISGFVVTEAAFLFYLNRPISFLKNRAIRLYPTYLLALSILLFLELLLTGFFVGSQVGNSDHYGSNAFVLDATVNALAVLPGSTVFSDYFQVTPKIDLVWALRIEVLFYLSLAAFIWVALRVGRFSEIVAFACFVGLAICGLVPHLVTERSPQFIPFFVLGTSGALLIHAGSKRLRASAFLLMMVSLPLIIGFILGMPEFHESGFRRELSLQLAIFLFGVIVLAGLVIFGSEEPIRLRLDSAAGQLSYPLYLMHAPALFLVSQLEVPKNMPIFFGVIFLSVLAALLTWLLFERRFETARAKIRGATLTPPNPAVLEPAVRSR